MLKKGKLGQKNDKNARGINPDNLLCTQQAFQNYQRHKTRTFPKAAGEESAERAS